MLTPSQIDALIAGYAEQLLTAPRQPIELTRRWVKAFPATPGIYAIFDNDELVYAGETGSLRGRMGDLLNTMNHNFRRQIGKRLFSDRAEFVPASSRRSFAPALEIELRDWIHRNAKVAVLPINFGRKEIEEFICDRHRPKCNDKLRRQ